MSLKYIKILIRRSAVIVCTAALITSCMPLKPVAAATDSWPDCPSVKAKSAIVMDLDTGAVLFAKHPKKKEYPASITKIMTATLAIEKAASLSEKVVFTDDAVNTGDNQSSSIGMLVGEKLTLEQALYGMLLPSANEVANAIAIHTGGTTDNFVKMMNEKAAELGCVNTHFANPCGLYNKNHYTCAYDMALIAKEAVKNPEFVKVAGSRKYVLPATNKMNETRPLANTHQMINPAADPEYAYEYCYAGKTGYTSEAGYTLVSCAKKGNMNVVCVVMHAGCRADQYESSLKLLDYAFKRFRMENSDKVPLDSAATGSALYTKIIKADPTATFTASGSSILTIPKKCDLESIKTRCIYDDSITSVSHGKNVIGSIDYTYMGHSVGSADLVYTSDKDLKLIDSAASGSAIVQKKDVSSKRASGNTFSMMLSFITRTVKGRIILASAACLIIFIVIYIIKVLIPRRKLRKRYMMHKKLRKSSGVDKNHIKLP